MCTCSVLWEPNERWISWKDYQKLLLWSCGGQLLLWNCNIVNKPCKVTAVKFSSTQIHMMWYHSPHISVLQRVSVSVTMIQDVFAHSLLDRKYYVSNAKMFLRNFFSFSLPPSESPLCVTDIIRLFSSVKNAMFAPKKAVRVGEPDPSLWLLFHRPLWRSLDVPKITWK